MLLQLLFPKRCVGCSRFGFYICDGCAVSFPLARAICPICRKASIGGVTHAGCQRRYGLDGLVNIFPYRGMMRVAIKQLKYRFVRDLTARIVEVSMRRIDDAPVSFFQREKFVVVPVPLHPKRERWRGFNQAGVLGERIAAILSLDYKNAMMRVSHTDALAELTVRLASKERAEIVRKYQSKTQQKEAIKKLLRSKKEDLRRMQMKGAFDLAENIDDVRGQRIVIVDDVWTSGATVMECAKVLKHSGALTVWGLTLARSGA